MVTNIDLVEYKSEDIDFAFMIDSFSMNATLEHEWDRYISLYGYYFINSWPTING
jgi:hypothetical protein